MVTNLRRSVLVQLGVNSCTPLELAAQLFKYFAP
jgi:hypothetical protein